VGKLLGAQGRVLPMAEVPLDITAEVVGLDPSDPSARRVETGQLAVATTRGRVVAIDLVPSRPPACAAAVEAVREADWVVLGPGSWFTSVLPHLLVPDLRRAIVETGAQRLVTVNVAPQPGETEGFTPDGLLDVLADHAADLRVDVVLVDERSVGDPDLLEAAAGRLGARVVLADVARSDGTARHDREKLSSAYARIMSAT
jgi:uncharacterized cofD-like protein